MRSALAILLVLSTGVLYSQAPAAPNPGAAQPPDTDQSVTALAKETQNPVGDIVSVPFQFNFNSGGAYVDQTFFNLNFQPVIPIHLTPKVTYITRTIIPVVSIPTSNGVSYSGVGDIQEQTFFTPAHPGKLILGIGPAFSFPTATAYPAKTGTWAGGGSLVILATPGPFVLGSLFTQLSPMHDSGRRAQGQQLPLAVLRQLQLRQRMGARHRPQHYRQLGHSLRPTMDRPLRRRHQPHPRLQQTAYDPRLPVLLRPSPPK
jgi:hypothetical protein